MKNGGYLMTSQKQQLNEQKMINHLSTVGILGNVILTAFKLLAGIIGHSGAMISDAVHSLSDVFATFIAFLGVKLSCSHSSRNGYWNWNEWCEDDHSR